MFLSIVPQSCSTVMFHNNRYSAFLTMSSELNAFFLMVYSTTLDEKVPSVSKNIALPFLISMNRIMNNLRISMCVNF